jgi:hypothetical protein
MVTLKSQTHGHAFGGQTDPADALPAFKHGKVAKADCSGLEHFLSGGRIATGWGKGTTSRLHR